MTSTDNTLEDGAAWPADADALAAVVARHADMVFSTCRRVLGNDTEAADVAQETFFQFYRQADEITTSIGAWLHQVATRRAIDLVRQNVSRRRREEAYTAESARVPDSWADVEPLVDDALAALPDDQRELLVLHFLERRTMTELARDHGVSQPTISRRVAAALDSLRAQLRARDVIVGVGVLSAMLPGSTHAAPAAVLGGLGKMSLAYAASAATAGGAAVAGVSTGTKTALVLAAAAILAGLTWLGWQHRGARSAAFAASAPGEARIAPAPVDPGASAAGLETGGIPEAPPPGMTPVPPLPMDAQAAPTPAGAASPGPGTAGWSRWTVSAGHWFGSRFGGGGYGGAFAGRAGVYATMVPRATGSFTATSTQGFHLFGSGVAVSLALTNRTAPTIEPSMPWPPPGRTRTVGRR